MIETAEKRDSEPLVVGQSREKADGPRVLFLAPGDVTKGRVEPISWMKTCSAYAKRGSEVTLVTLRVRRPDAIQLSEVWQHYGIEPGFRLVVVPTLLGRRAPIWWFRSWAGAAALTFALRTVLQQLASPRPTIVHVRLPILAAPFLVMRQLLPPRRRPRVVFETHSLPKQAHGWIVRRTDLVVTNSERLAEDVRLRFDLPAARVLHAPLGPYNDVRPVTTEAARAELALPAEAVIACYTGKMTEEHNDFLLRAAAQLAGRVARFRLVLVGGNPEILDWTRERVGELGISETVELPGFVAPARVALYQSAADVLVYHMPESMEIFPYCTPAKGFEYQAAGKPVVATDIPLFEEVFGRDGERAIRVCERTPEALAEGVLKALALADGGRAMTERAAAWVKERTWDRRTEAILAAVDL